MARIAFWLSLLIPLYAFVLYPLLVYAVSRLSPRGLPRVPPSDGTLPSVSIVIAAHNEEAHIGTKLATLDCLDYPRDRLEIIVASDGSADRTVDRARSHAGAIPVRVLDLPRGGKAAALNAAVPLASGDIIVFTDADNRWLPATLRSLVAPFADPGIGAVGGHIEIADTGRSLGIGDRVYRQFESWLRLTESRAGCLVSIDGAIQAVRRELFQPVPADVTDDFYIGSAAPAHGMRIGYAPDAVVIDQGLSGAGKQFRRRVRVTVRGLQSLASRRALLNPFRHGRYAIALLSHKVLRRLAPVFLLPLLLSSLLLINSGDFYCLAAWGQIVGYTIALAGVLDRRKWLPKPFHLAGFALLAVAGLVWGVLRFATGHRLAVWNPAENR